MKLIGQYGVNPFSKWAVSQQSCAQIYNTYAGLRVYETGNRTGKFAVRLFQNFLFFSPTEDSRKLNDISVRIEINFLLSGRITQLNSVPTVRSIFSKVYLCFLFLHKFSFNYLHRFSLDLSYPHFGSTSVLSHTTSCATKGVFIGITLCG